jgi:Concanavalin A-like lectin/glucanases superfamily
VPRAGRHGDAVRIALKSSPLVFFKGERNIAWTPRDWSGTVSVWFSLDPDRDLLPGYSDPLIITPRAWNDAALFVDFTRDDVPRKFRFAAFADRAVWDPAKREWEAVPVAERPMIELAGGRFAAGRWTHVAWTWERFNTAGPDGVLTAYIDGAPVGTLSGRPQTYTWDPAEVLIALGVQFRGLMDELSIFDRALTAAEIQALHGLTGGVRAWHPAAR